MRMVEHALLANAGIGGSRNGIRSLRKGDPSLKILDDHDNQFLLPQSLGSLQRRLQRDRAWRSPGQRDLRGRFLSATTHYDLTGPPHHGGHRRPLALGTPVEVRAADNVAEDHDMRRALDSPRRVFHADDFFEGIKEVGP